MANSLNWRGKINFGTGDTIKVHQTVIEGNKTRTQVFEGIVIRIRGHQGLKTFTVRKIGANNIGVEKIFPENTPTVTNVELKKRGKVRRAVLSYLNKRIGKKATKIKDVFVKAEVKEVPKEESAVEKPVEVKSDKPDLAKNKVVKRPKTDKPKKIKKGPKKIVRKERVFVR